MKERYSKKKEKSVIASQDIEEIFHFAKQYEDKADIGALQNAFIDCLYLYSIDTAKKFVPKFAKEVKGASVTDMVGRLFINGFEIGNSVIFELAKNDKNLDTKKLEEFAARATEPFVIFEFVRNVKVDNEKELLEIANQIEEKLCF